LFGREGVTRAVREKVARGIVYSRIALRGEGFDLLLDHIAAAVRGMGCGGPPAGF
jgi:hypothetical protein